MLTPIGRNEKMKNSSMIGVSASATKRIRAACPGARDRRRPAGRPRAVSDDVTVDIGIPLLNAPGRLLGRFGGAFGPPNSPIEQLLIDRMYTVAFSSHFAC